MKTLTNEMVTNYLINKGFKPCHLGFRYWSKAIQLAFTDRKYLKKIYKLLLEQLQIEFDVGAQSIQSALRLALRYAQPKETTANFLAQAILDMEELCK